jgi:chromosome segregation ATPase
MIAELASVKTLKASLDKTREQRRSDYNNSKHKHATFPSLPELQIKLKSRDDRRWKELDDEEKKVRDVLAEALGQLPSNSPVPGSLVETHAYAKESQLQSLRQDVDAKVDTISKTLQVHQDNSKGASEVLKAQVELLKKQFSEQKAREAELKANMETGLLTVRDAFQQEIKALHEQSKAAQAQQAEQSLKMGQEMVAKFNDQGRQMKSQLLDQLKRQEEESKAQLRRQEEESKAQLKRQEEEMKAQVKKQQDLIAQLNKQQEELAQLKKQQEELSAQLRRHQEASTVEFKKQKDNPVKNSTKSLDTASSKDLAAIRKEYAKLKSENDALRSDFSSALLRVGELEKREALSDERATSRENDLRTLSESVATCLQKVEEQAEKVSKSEETLMNLDIQGLNDIGEVSVAFPRVQHQVRELQDGLKAQQEGLKAVQDGVVRLDNVNNDVLETVGSWVDSLRKRDDDQGKEIQALRERVGAMEGTSSNNPAPIEDTTTKAEVATVKTELDRSLAQTKEELDAVRKKEKETTEFLLHQISVLEQRYNNITTKEMAERILGVMETVYPTAKNIESVLSLIQSGQESQKRQLAGVEEEGKATKRRVSETESRCEKLEAMLESIVRHSREVNDQSTREIEIHARKRARREAYPNGMSRSASNGVIYANGVNGEDHS